MNIWIKLSRWGTGVRWMNKFKETNLIFHTIWKSESEVAKLCPTLCDPMDCSLPHSSVHEIFQARVLEWVAISFSRGSSWPRDQTPVSRIVGRHFTIWATIGKIKKGQVVYKESNDLVPCFPVDRPESRVWYFGSG